MQAAVGMRCSRELTWHQQPGSTRQHLSCRTQMVTRYQPLTGTDVSASTVRFRQSGGIADRADDPAIPAPQEMQASVMLVPKEAATQNLLKQASSADSPLNSFLVKCRLAWNLFFPPQDSAGSTRQLSPKELGKQRLSMILVADRCGLSPNSLVEMKRSTLAALQDCMDLEDLQDAHLRFTMTRENGVTYSMAVPILRPDPYADEAVGEREDETGMAAASTLSASWEDEELDDILDAPSSSSRAAVRADSPRSMRVSPAGFKMMQPPGSLEGPGVAPSPTAAGAACGGQGLTPTAPEPGAPAAGELVVQAGPSPTAAEVPSAPRTGSSTGSRGGSPIEITLDGTAVMTPSMLKELLVEELVHDVEELVEHMAAQPADGVNAGPAGQGAAAAGVWGPAGDAGAGAVSALAEQLQAAVEEVQHFGEQHGTREGTGEGLRGPQQGDTSPEQGQ